MLRKTSKKNNVFPLTKIDFSKVSYEEHMSKLFIDSIRQQLEPAHSVSLKKCLARFEAAGQQWEENRQQLRTQDSENNRRQLMDKRTLEIEAKQRHLSLKSSA